jgi:hypothetical protein
MMVTSIHSAAEKFSGMRWIMVVSLLDVATFMRGMARAATEPDLRLALAKPRLVSYDSRNSARRCSSERYLNAY